MSDVLTYCGCHCVIAVMVPMPAGGDDLPQSDNGLGTSPPPPLTVSSSDEDDEAPADAGYQPLPQGEPGDDVTGESETETDSTTETASTSTPEEAFCRSVTSNIVLQSSHLPPVTNVTNLSCANFLFIIYNLIVLEIV